MNSNDIIKYLESKPGEIDPNVKEWLKNPANDPEVREILGRIWSNSEIHLSGVEPEFENLLRRVHYRIDNEKDKTDSKVPKLKRLYQSFSRIAAIIIIPLLVVSIYLFQNQQSVVDVPEEVFVREIHTKPGAVTNVKLPDGTLVWLNSKTILKYPETFEKNKREVFVDGEAYFEVTSNAQRPFIVNNPMMKTVVTGTRFNLRAYSADQFFEATLLEGKIHLESEDRKIEVVPGQQIQFDAAKNRLTRKEINPSLSTSWIDGKLVIHNERLETAIKKLSRWYNVDMIIIDPLVANYELKCTLEDEKLSQCIELISQALPINMELKEVRDNEIIKRKIYIMAK